MQTFNKEDLNRSSYFLSVIYLSKSTMQPIEQWDLFDFVAMRRLSRDFHIKLYNFVRNILMNISITISWLYPLHGFLF